MAVLFYIWSFEHTQFWRPNSQGYTTSVREAGKYEEAEAREIVGNALGDEIAFIVTGYGADISLPHPDVIVFDPSTAVGTTITTHGLNADCPQVQNGAWGHCKGHDSRRRKCAHGSDLGEVCRLCDPTVNMSPRVAR